MKSTYPVAVLYSLLFASSSGRSNAISASYRSVGFHYYFSGRNVDRTRESGGNRAYENSAWKNKKSAARGSERTPVGWLVYFHRFCQHSSIADVNETCDMAAVRDLSTSDKQHALRSMNGKAGGISTIIVVCLVLQAIIKDQVEQLNKLGVARTAIGIDEKAVKNRKVRDCV